MVVPERSAATVIHAVYDAWADGDTELPAERLVRAT